MYILKKPVFIPHKIIEKDAEQLIAEYERLTGQALTKPPVPLDYIAEFVLDLTVDYVESLAGFDGKNVLGETHPNHMTIKINWGQLKYNLGRRNFTLAHEIGHFRLHLQRVPPDTHITNLELPLTSRITKKTGQNKDFESQADYFAGCLLMPKKLLWNHPQLKDELPPVYTLAEDFHVSPAAMKIRLEKLNMLYIASDKKVYCSKEASAGQKRLF